VSDLLRKPALAGFLLCFMAVASGAIHSARAASVMSSQDARAPQEKPAAPEKAPEKHTTLEDRQRLVAIAHKLEATPLDPALGPERAWAVSWTVAAPDIHVRICTSLLSDLRRPPYKYKSQIGDQLLISSAAFLIEHPDQAAGIARQSVGGMEGVLKAYSAIIKADPQATAKSLDALLAKQHDGKLAEAVGEIVKDCH